MSKNSNWLCVTLFFALITHSSKAQTVPLSDCTNWLSLPSYLSYAEAGRLNITGNQITVEAIFNRTTPYSGGLLYAGDLVSKHNTPEDVNYLLRPNEAEITTTNGYFRTPNPCVEIQLNRTYHVAMVYNGNTLKFYRDGILLTQVAASGNLVQNNWKTRIGFYEPQGYNTNFIGYINEVRIWNIARTQGEIRANMNISLPNPSSQTGLQAYYTFDALTNKQGNAAYNAVLAGNASINQTNPACTLVVDSCNSVTPVILTSITTQVKNNDRIILNWQTEEEYSISTYFVQRSLSPDKGFSNIGSVTAVNNQRSHSYAFEDKTVQPGPTYFYRLLIMERSGTSRYSPVRSEKIPTRHLYASVYPNPTQGNTTLTIAGYTGRISINLFNAVGESVFATTRLVSNNSGNTISLQQLPKGSYWLQVLTTDDRIVKKIICQ